MHEETKSLADKTVQILSDSKKKEGKTKDDPKTSRAEPVPEIKTAIDASKLAHDEPTDTAIVTEKMTLSRRTKHLWSRFVKELRHYYDGFRLLFIDVRICSRYVWNVLNGATLTRRERKQVNFSFNYSSLPFYKKVTIMALVLVTVPYISLF